MIRLALTDLDDTLIPVGASCVSAYARAAIHTMLYAGLWFGPVSGRVPAAMRWMFDGDEACCQTGAFVNGQIIYAQGELVREKRLDSVELARVGCMLHEYEGCALVIYDLEDISETTDGMPYYMGASRRELARHAACFGPHPRTIERLEQSSYLKANIRCDCPWEEMVALRDRLRGEFPSFHFVFPASPGPFIDILPRGWDKGRAVQVLASHLKLSLEEVVVFGDSENDLSMLRAVPHSVAVGNASDEVLAVARHHIGCAEDDAVAHALFEIAEAAREGSLPQFLRT